MHRIANTAEVEVAACHHCGDKCPTNEVSFKNYHFCCIGCKSVYMILSSHDLTDYYGYNESPGASRRDVQNRSYSFLEDPQVIERLVFFKEGNIAKVKLQLPQIHCTACIWLLERLPQINSGIRHVTIVFAKKQAILTFNSDDIQLRGIVELLDKIGYPPSLHLDRVSSDQLNSDVVDRSILYKLGLAGFAFGNIMLLSFPEYFGLTSSSSILFLGYLKIVLATPLLFFGGFDFLKSAWKGLIHRVLNLDVPISIGMLTLYLRSVIDITFNYGEGYLDSFSGFLFFLLIGRWFQSVTYEALDFNRNYKSYFPLSATIKRRNSWISIPLQKVVPGDILLVRNQELIPVDSKLVRGTAHVDYSFVTGESTIVNKYCEDELYAGGRHSGMSIEIEANQKVDESYLTELWNEEIFDQKEESGASKLIDSVSKYFTIVIVSIALLTLFYWIRVDMSKAFESFSAVLIVACPCALALTIPFTYGNVVRILARKGFCIRNVSIIEKIHEVDTVIFDKTGTLTDSSKIRVKYEGGDFREEWALIKSACFHSSHPLSRSIVAHLNEYDLLPVSSFQDVPGKGIVANINEREVRVGSSDFIFNTSIDQRKDGVFVEVDNEYIGYFSFQHQIRNGVQSMIHSLSKKYETGLISGDTDRDVSRMKELFPLGSMMKFFQRPKDKLKEVERIQGESRSVMMIGDGLNDAGALKQSDVGIVISDQKNNYFPSCDGLLDANLFSSLSHILNYVKFARGVVFGAFGLAFIYNFIGLYFATTGQLSPVVAAILMPLSSITVVVYGVLLTYIGKHIYLD